MHFTIRLEEERLCTLVVIGVRPDRTKEVVALEDGYRESAESWHTLLRDLKRRGLRAPVLAIVDGALGFWAVVRDVWPETAEQRCWVHRIANVFGQAPPKPATARQAGAARDHVRGETRAAAEREIARFTAAYQAKYPKAVHRSPSTRTGCSRTSIIRPSIGNTCAPRIRSVDVRRCDCAKT